MCKKIISVLFPIVGLMNSVAFAQDQAKSEFSFQGLAILQNQKVACTVKIESDSRERWISYKNDLMNNDITFNLADRKQNSFRGTFEHSVPGSRIGWDYTPAEKSSGELIAHIDSHSTAWRASVKITNCVELTVLGIGTGLFKCNTIKQVCAEN